MYLFLLLWLLDIEPDGEDDHEIEMNVYVKHIFSIVLQLKIGLCGQE